MEGGFRGLGQLMMILGAFLLIGGALLYGLSSRHLSWPKLPGDIVIERPGFKFVLPLGTSLLLSLVLTLIFWAFRRFLDR